MKFFSHLTLLFLSLFISCRFASSKKEILGIDSMKVVMWDMLKADELFIRILVKDTLASKKKENIRLYEEVFLIHHTTKKQFDSSYKFYASHPFQFKILVDSLDAFSNREKNKLLEQHGQARKAENRNIPK